MKKKNTTQYLKTVGTTLVAAGLLSATSAWAGTAFFDFESDPAGDPALQLFGNAAWWGGLYPGDTGFLSITDAAGSQRSAIVFADIDNGQTVDSFVFEAKLRVGNGTTDPADGFSVNYARAGDPVLVAASSGGNPATDGGMWARGQNCEDNLPEEGTKTGIAIGFDAWNSGGTPGSLCDVINQSIGADVRALTVRLDGILIAQFPLPNNNGACDDPTSLQTGPNDGSNSAENLCWAPLKVELTKSKQLSVWWKNSQLLTNYQTEYFPSPGRLVFAGRTGGSHQNQHVDDIRITTTVIVPDTEKPTDPANLAVVPPLSGGRVELTWTASTDNSGNVGYQVERNGVVFPGLTTATRYVDTTVQSGTAYTYRVRASDSAGNVSEWISLQVTTPTEVELYGTVKVDIFDAINGTSINDLLGAQKFIDNNPDRSTYALGLLIGSANGLAGWNGSFGDNFGLRATGVLIPTETAQYDFFIRSDDASWFYLNQTGAAIPNPLVDFPLIQENGCCNSFYEPSSGDESVTATPVSLVAGQSYGFTVLLKEGGGGDGVAVGMRKVGDTTPAANVPAIAGLSIKGISDAGGGILNITRNPSTQTVVANQRAEFSVGVTNYSFYNVGAWYQWLRNGTPIAGAVATNYVIPVASTSDSGAQFSVVVGSIGNVKTSAVAILTVNVDTLKPLVRRVAGDSDTLDSLVVTFSEPVTAPTATTAANYTVSGGVTVSAAALVDQFNVRLTTSKQAEATPYTLTVNNVADNAGNVIEANSAVNFRSWGLVPNRARGDIFDGISGTAVSALTLDQKWIDNAFDRTTYPAGLLVGSQNGLAGWNNSFGDNFGMRIVGILKPTETAQYHFFIRSDDASQFFLNTGGAALPDVTGTPLIEETGCCAAFLDPGTDAATTTTPVSLTAGQSYGFVVLLKEGGGGDGVAVGMRKVGDTTASANVPPIQSTAYWYGPLVNVLAPNNAIVATSENSPAAERAPNAIDGLATTKYLNFDKLNAGFTVTPAAASTIQGIALTSANDAVERDPTSFKIEGSVNGTSWTTVAEGSVAAFPARFTRREYFFNNGTAYTQYRVTFPTVNNATTANSMQIAEVELLGYFGGTLAVAPENPSLSVSRAANGDLVITFEGTLEATDSLGGTWTDVGTTSPQTIQPTGSMRFFRARQ